MSRETMAARRSGGLWRWGELLPVQDAGFITYLGEGDTPLQPAPRLGSWLGLRRLEVKREWLRSIEPARASALVRGALG